MSEWSSGFSYCLQLKPEFFNEKLMIWATVNSRSYFCWLYRAPPIWAAKNIISLILVLTIWWCPYVESSFVLFAMTSALSWQTSVSLLRFVLQGQICLLLQLCSTLCDPMDCIACQVPLSMKFSRQCSDTCQGQGSARFDGPQAQRFLSPLWA